MLFLVIFDLGLSYALEMRKICIIKNISESLPFSYFFGYPIKNVTRGMYVSFYHPDFKSLIVKKVTGVPGDEICVQNSEIYVNHIPNGQIKNLSSSGIELSALEDTIIPEGFIYVSGFHEASFDSRYKQFGLIPIKLLKERVWPIY